MRKRLRLNHTETSLLSWTVLTCHRNKSKTGTHGNGSPRPPIPRKAHLMKIVRQESKCLEVDKVLQPRKDWLSHEKGFSYIYVPISLCFGTFLRKSLVKKGPKCLLYTVA
ncbi:hypothetical protein XELAEV_18027571mg [Xenopus laevis]|uniref:Uncharacterized protein n=1 Tax=Xenopus laevis TaxID=8355 RepID=A0A974CVM2_XENLA|nr:hypothetical protein XELAEV_18027571mg [Xenopus laevis]